MKRALSLALIIVTTMLFLCITLPFISFDNKPYSSIITEAATLYGISANEYKVEFAETVLTSKGTKVQGLFTLASRQDGTEYYRIQIRKSNSRPMMIETIFHEFAHAAQHKHNMDTGKYNNEQHAEILSFSIMWQNGYRWDALHLLTSHTFGAKPAQYRATNELWTIAFSGTAKYHNYLTFKTNQ